MAEAVELTSPPTFKAVGLVLPVLTVIHPVADLVFWHQPPFRTFAVERLRLFCPGAGAGAVDGEEAFEHVRALG